MRKLWEDHITYTRGYIVSALADLPDTNAVATRLLKNQDDIGDAIKPYYGENAGKRLLVLSCAITSLSRRKSSRPQRPATSRGLAMRRRNGQTTARTLRRS